jgi:lactobin A/cerein 7B family class IIb bacteriocin
MNTHATAEICDLTAEELEQVTGGIVGIDDVVFGAIGLALAGGYVGAVIGGIVDYLFGGK